MLNKFDLSSKLLNQIRDTSHTLGVPEFVIEKGFYVTKAISIVSKISHEHYDLIFQGGTALAKAHRIIERMSEDCDFRARFKDQGKILSKEYRRKILRQFRHELIEKLRDSGFVIDKENVRVRNEGKFMAIRANYPSSFSAVKTIKPFIALEFFLNNIRVSPQIKPVITLIGEVLGEKVAHAEFPVNSVAIIETAAEKWVALTRRVATSRHRKHYRDANLVRHLYDLYKINMGGYFTNQFPALVTSIVMDDRKQYKNHNNDNFINPVSEIEYAINELQTSAEWQKNWRQFAEAMIFEDKKPSYKMVINNLQEKSAIALKSLLLTKFH